METRRRQAVTDTFSVVAADGRRFEVVETTIFVSFCVLSGKWSPEQVEKISQRTGNVPVNPAEPGWYEVLQVPAVRCQRL